MAHDIPPTAPGHRPAGLSPASLAVAAGRPAREPGAPVDTPPEAAAPVVTAPLPVLPDPRPPVPSLRPSRPYYEMPDPEPSVQSRGALTDGEARALRGVRQSIDASVNELERRARFGDTTAAEDRELRTLKARQRDVLRRLRGG